jgi:hypothetical protein
MTSDVAVGTRVSGSAVSACTALSATTQVMTKSWVWILPPDRFFCAHRHKFGASGRQQALGSGSHGAGGCRPLASAGHDSGWKVTSPPVHRRQASAMRAAVVRTHRLMTTFELYICSTTRPSLRLLSSSPPPSLPGRKATIQLQRSLNQRRYRRIRPGGQQVPPRPLRDPGAGARLVPIPPYLTNQVRERAVGRSSIATAIRERGS